MSDVRKRTTSEEGVALIKRFEGCVLKAYKAVATERYWTIGFGHYGPDVHQGDVITMERATELLKLDLQNAEAAVNKAGKWEQHEFDALVSFTYNCGPGNMGLLLRGRNKQQIADAMLLYVKSGGITLQGLVRRRRAERQMFLMDGAIDNVETVSKPPAGSEAPKPKKKVDKSVEDVETPKKRGRKPKDNSAKS